MDSNRKNIEYITPGKAQHGGRDKVMSNNQKNIDGVYIIAGKACHTLNKYLGKWLNQTDLISDEDEYFLRKIVKICSDVSQLGCNTFSRPFCTDPIYYMTDGEATKTRFEDIISKLIDVGIIGEQYEYNELKVVNDVLTSIWITNAITATFNPVPSDKEWFWRFKCEPKEVR